MHEEVPSGGEYIVGIPSGDIMLVAKERPGWIFAASLSAKAVIVYQGDWRYATPDEMKRFDDEGWDYYQQLKSTKTTSDP